jgi:hypothetical protein
MIGGNHSGNFVRHCIQRTDGYSRLQFSGNAAFPLFRNSATAGFRCLLKVCRDGPHRPYPRSSTTTAKSASWCPSYLKKNGLRVTVAADGRHMRSISRGGHRRPHRPRRHDAGRRRTRPLPRAAGGQAQGDAGADADGAQLTRWTGLSAWRWAPTTTSGEAVRRPRAAGPDQGRPAPGTRMLPPNLQVTELGQLLSPSAPGSSTRPGRHLLDRRRHGGRAQRRRISPAPRLRRSSRSASSTATSSSTSRRGARPNCSTAPSTCSSAGCASACCDDPRDSGLHQNRAQRGLCLLHAGRDFRRSANERARKRSGRIRPWPRTLGSRLFLLLPRRPEQSRYGLAFSRPLPRTLPDRQGRDARHARARRRDLRSPSSTDCPLDERAELARTSLDRGSIRATSWATAWPAFPISDATLRHGNRRPRSARAVGPIAFRITVESIPGDGKRLPGHLTLSDGNPLTIDVNPAGIMPLADWLPYTLALRSLFCSFFCTWLRRPAGDPPAGRSRQRAADALDPNQKAPRLSETGPSRGRLCRRRLQRDARPDRPLPAGARCRSSPRSRTTCRRRSPA